MKSYLVDVLKTKNLCCIIAFALRRSERERNYIDGMVVAIS
jgi:hypothetical protein